MFDRVTGKPVWPIEERPVPQSTCRARERRRRSRFRPSRAASTGRDSRLDDLIDFTPELKAEAVKIASQYLMGPLFTPPIVRDTDGKMGTLLLPHHTGGANWPGGAVDPETGILYVASLTNHDALALTVADPKRSDMGYVGGGGGEEGAAQVRRHPMMANRGRSRRPTTVRRACPSSSRHGAGSPPST